MDIVEYAEKIIGVELLAHQKILLREFAEKTPTDAKICIDICLYRRRVAALSEQKEQERFEDIQRVLFGMDLKDRA